MESFFYNDFGEIQIVPDLSLIGLFILTGLNIANLENTNQLTIVIGVILLISISSIVIYSLINKTNVFTNIKELWSKLPDFTFWGLTLGLIIINIIISLLIKRQVNNIFY